MTEISDISDAAEILPGQIRDEPPPSPGEPVVEIRDLNVTFKTEDGPVYAVRGVDMDVRAGEVLGIVGESGSGKSVTMLAVLGLLPRTATVTGSVRYRGDELIGRRRKEMEAIRGEKIAMIFQDPLTALNPVHRVGHQISEAVRAHHRDISKTEALLARGGPARCRRHPAARGAREAVPARVLGWHATTGDDRDDDRERP